MDSQFTTDCSNVELKQINLAFCATGTICCIVSAIILLLIFILKEYSSVLQRLFLYLMVAIFFRELFMAASFEHQFKYDPILQDKVCAGIGFIWNWTGILVFVFTVGMKVYLLFYVYHFTRGNTGPIIVKSARGRIALETSFVVLTIIVTFLYSSVPFSTDNFGLAGPWCWVRALYPNKNMDTNCTISTSGVVHQILNGYVFYISGSVIGLILLIATIVLYCRLPMAYNNENSKMLLKKSFSVIITFVVNIVMMVFAFLARVFAAKEQQFNLSGVWYSFGITFPISLLLFPVIYMICFFKLNTCGLCTRCNAEHIEHDKPNPSVEKPTIRSSSRFSAPSVTEFEPPYTDEFTDSRELEHERLVYSDSKDQAMASGYGSVNAADGTSSLNDFSTHARVKT